MRWQAAGAAERYALARWSSARRRERDPRLVAQLLARHLASDAPALLLDAPCGAGRLHGVLARRGRYVGLDASRSMLSQARSASVADSAEHMLLCGDVTRLPFRDSSFDAVVCCRLLHHLGGDAALEQALSELVRVSRALLIASFWDAGCLPVWRRALLPSRRAPRRFARPRAALAAAVWRAGAEVVAWKHSLRFVSRQAFVVARKRPAR
jgi:SAM-dependent methyltransferase